MPQMSPISWTLIFLMIILTMTSNMNLMGPLCSPQKTTKTMEKKEKQMKW